MSLSHPTPRPPCPLCPGGLGGGESALVLQRSPHRPPLGDPSSVTPPSPAGRPGKGGVWGGRSPPRLHLLRYFNPSLGITGIYFSVIRNRL